MCQAAHPVFMRSLSLFPVPGLPLKKPFAKNLPKIRESLDQVPAFGPIRERLAAGGEKRAVKISEPRPAPPPTVHIGHDQSAFPVAFRYYACSCTGLGRAKQAGDHLMVWAFLFSSRLA